MTVTGGTNSQIFCFPNNQPTENMTKQYAEDFGIQQQQKGESDDAFRHRVAGELRNMGHLIEAHEVQAGKRYDDGPDAMTGILGAVAMALAGRSYGSSGSGRVGDEIAAGHLVRFDISPEGQAQKASDNALASLLAGGMEPSVLASLSGRR